MDWNRKVDIEDYHAASDKDMAEIAMDLFSFFKIYSLHPIDVARSIANFTFSFSEACKDKFSVVGNNKNDSDTDISKIVSDMLLQLSQQVKKNEKRTCR